MSRRWLLPCLLAPVLLAAPASTALAGGGREEPILLTNEDVKRLRPAPPGPDTASAETGSNARLIVAPSPSPAAPRPAAPSRRRGSEEGARQASSPAEPPTPPAYRGPASSWREEYYRLKALALQRSLERGDPIDFGDDEAAPESPAAPATAHSDASPACFYDARDALIHAPDGRPCRTNRRDAQVIAPRSNRVSDRSCLYGHRGEVLYSPPGEDCSR